jgi:recombination associated protein RdgC
MEVLERIRRTEFLGRDFLIWLWFKSETNEGRFDLGDLGSVELLFDGRVTLQSDGDTYAETITCSGENPPLREARFALTKSKKVTQAALRLIVGDNEWSFTLDSTWLNFKSLKTPTVAHDKKDDPDGLFYERIFLIEQPLRAIDTLFSAFTKTRTSPEWDTQELPALMEWINQGK